MVLYYLIILFWIDLRWFLNARVYSEAIVVLRIRSFLFIFGLNWFKKVRRKLSTVTWITFIVIQRIRTTIGNYFGIWLSWRSIRNFYLLNVWKSIFYIQIIVFLKILKGLYSLIGIFAIKYICVYCFYLIFSLRSDLLIIS